MQPDPTLTGLARLLTLVGLVAFPSFPARAGDTAEPALPVAHATFEPHGVRIRLPADPGAPGAGHAFDLRLVAFGRGGAPAPADDPTPGRSGERIEYRRSGLVEWYLPEERGLEHGFDLPVAPAVAPASAAEPLTLEIAVGGDLVPLVDPNDSRSALLVDARGNIAARYADLVALDADGVELDARVEVDGRSLRIRVDDRGARYPLVVDPLLLTETVKVLPGQQLFGAELFGHAVSLDGDTLMVGMPLVPAFGSGAALTFRRTGNVWNPDATIVPLDAVTGDEIGWSLDLEVPFAAISALGADDMGLDAGAVYVFFQSASGWNQVAKLTAGDGEDIDELGNGVDLDGGDTVITGARLDDDRGQNAGAAYVFTRTGSAWSQQGKLLASDGAAQDWFGPGAALDGDTAVVGAFRANAPKNDSGAAYVYQRTGTLWSEVVKLTASDAAVGDNFGRETDIDGDTIVVGAPRGPGMTANSGAVYVYGRSGTTWVETGKVFADDGTNNDGFGRSVALQGDHLVVGANFEDDTALDAGAAYVFRREGTVWTQQSKLLASDGAEDDRFGADVALDGLTVAVGALSFDGGGAIDTGAAYAFHRPYITFTYCTGKTNSLGCVPSIDARGIPSPSGTGAYLVEAQDLVPGNRSVLFYAFRRGDKDFHGGKLCIRSPLERLTGKKALAGPGVCGGTISRDFNKRIRLGVDPMLTAGQAVRAQWYQLDPGDPAGFGDGLTDAVQFTIQP